MTWQPRIKTHSNIKAAHIGNKTQSWNQPGIPMASPPPPTPARLSELLDTQTFLMSCLSLLSTFLSPIGSAVDLLQSHANISRVSAHCPLPRGCVPSKSQQNVIVGKCFVIWGLCVNWLLSTGANYLRNTTMTFSRCHAPRLPKRNLFVKARWASALLTEMSYLSVFSSSHMPLVSGSSPAQAELGFSLGPQSHACSQLSTSNTGDREERHLDMSREI